MLQAVFLFVHLAMIAAGTYFMADMTNLALRSYLESSIEKSSRSTKMRPQSTGSGLIEDFGDYRVITQRDIFNSRKKVRPVKDSEPQDHVTQAAAKLPPLNLTLIGTAVLKGLRPYAIIKDPKQKKQTLYRKGDVIGGLFGTNDGRQAKIIAIERNKIVLLRGGRKEVLEVKVDNKKKQRGVRRTARRASPPKTNATGSIRQVSDNQWLLDRRELDNALKNLPQLLTKARIIPSFKDGKPDGFRIFAIARDSLYQKIGLQNGDILHRINSVDVRNPQNFMKVLEQLKDESSINIDLVRNNQKQTFNYEIR